MKNTLWINNKNQKLYKVINEGIDCTNERDGLTVVIYSNFEDERLFVREKQEFFNKFTEKRG